MFYFDHELYVEVENLLYMRDVFRSIRVSTNVMLIPRSRRGCSSRVTVAVQDVFDGLLQGRHELVTGLEEISLFLLYLHHLKIALVGIERRGQGLDSNQAS